MINLSDALEKGGLLKITQFFKLYGVAIIPLSSFSDSRGRLSFVDFNSLRGLDIKRIFTISNIPPGVIRGNHAHKSCTQLLHAVVPDILLELDGSNYSIQVKMDTPDVILVIPPKIWVKFSASSPKSVLNVLATEFYDKDDYINDYDKFREEINND